MARSRRRNRRSTSQNAASLLALALPAPFQRVANSQLGPMLIFFGLPALLILGLLQVDLRDGTPQFRVNPQKTSELKAAVREHLGNIENQPLIRQWQQATGQTWNSQQTSIKQQLPQQQSASQQHYQYPQQTAAQPPNGNSSVVRNTQAPFPSTNPPSYVSTTSRPQTTNPNYSLQQQQQYAQQQYAPQQYGTQPYAQQSTVPSQQLYAQSPYSQQQPMVSLQQPYSQPQYTQQQLSEQQLYQQRLYEQRLYEQRLYEQQLYQQQRYQQQSAQQQPVPTAQSLPTQPAWRNR